MTPERIHLLRKSFAEIEPRAEVAALVFYRRLFEVAPGVRALFKGSIEEQARKLMEMLSIGLSLIERPGALETEMRQLGARHVGYGAQDEHYAVVGGALLDMLAETLGDAFTPAVRAAWTEFYTTMAECAVRGAEAARAERTT